MPVSVTTDAAASRAYAGRIGFVSPTAEFTPKTVETRELRTDLVYRLRVVVEDPDGGLRQGMPVSVTVPLANPRKRTFQERLFEALWLDPLGFGAEGRGAVAAELLAILDSVTKRFAGEGAPAVDVISARIVGGQVTGLVGPDGAGKTTLMRLMAGLLLPSEGAVRACGFDTRTELDAVKQAVSY